MKRPSTVPDAARWNSHDREWLLGEGWSADGRPTGACRAWSEKGVLVAEYTSNAEGELDGVRTRFHPDGSVASRGEWKDDRRHGRFMLQQSENPTEERYSEDERTWRYEFEATSSWGDENPRWFLKDGTPSTSDGRPLATAFDMDEVIDTSAPDDFLRDRAAVCYQALAGAEPEVHANAYGLRELWGIDTSELDRLLALLPEAGSYSPTRLRDGFRGNCWETLLFSPSSNIDEELSSIFMGAATIGRVGDSDLLYATLFRPLRSAPSPNAVYYWSHELYYLGHVVSRTLDDYAFLHYVSLSHEAERLSDEVAARAWRKLAGRVSPPWAFESGSELAFADAEKAQAENTPGIGGDIDSDGHIRGYYWRAEWLIKLLRPDGQRELEVVAKAFHAGHNPRWVDAASFEVSIDEGQRIAPLALYVLWRLFWFEDKRLNRALDAFAAHSSCYVTDLVDLLRRFEAGLTGVRGLQNVQGLRGAVRELGLEARLKGE